MKTLKKSRILLAIMAIGMIWPAISQANTINIAVYASTTKDGWSQRGVPASWSGMFDYSINLNDELVDLVGFSETSAGNFANLSNTSKLKSTISPALVAKVYSIYQSLNISSPLQVRFILVGEGPAGGYLMRILAGEAQNLGLTTISKFGITLAHAEFSVVTVGTPNQGLPLVEATFGSTSGMRNVKPTIEDSKDAIYTALETEQNKYLAIIADAGLGLAQLFAVATNNIELVSRLNSIRDIVHSAPELAKMAAEDLEAGYSEVAFWLKLKTKLDATGLNLKNAIGPGHLQADRSVQGEGSLIQYINNLPNPSYYRNVIGSEKTPTPVRLAPEIYQRSTADETESKSYYEALRYAFKAEADAWNAQAKVDAALVGLFSGADSRDRHRRDNYNRGRTALDNLDSDWGYIIGSYRYETRTGTRRVYDPNKCSGGGGLPSPYALKAEDIDLLIPIDDPNCDPWRYESYTYTVRIALKNDGALSPHYAVWKRGNNPNDRGHNWHYSDAGDGGYNALELMRYRRTYTQGANLKGQRAKPMYDTEQWLRSTVLN